ncbi:hypothetical protein HY572_01530 [Candidatus Micrarchaeota archaeon]|nr:hypothetical protein [Candidatus Micrarchaeota archaeon]
MGSTARRLTLHHFKLPPSTQGPRSYWAVELPNRNGLFEHSPDLAGPLVRAFLRAQASAVIGSSTLAPKFRQDWRNLYADLQWLRIRPEADWTYRSLGNRLLVVFSKPSIALPRHPDTLPPMLPEPSVALLEKELKALSESVQISKEIYEGRKAKKFLLGLGYPLRMVFQGPLWLNRLPA